MADTTLYDYALTTLVSVKTPLGITDTASDILLEGLINAVTTYIENYCGRRFKKTAYTDELYDGKGDCDLILKNFPISDKEEYTLSVALVSGDSESVINVSDCDIYYDEGIIGYSHWPRGRRNIKVSYSAGYAAIPADLAQACVEIVSTIYKRRNSSESKSESIGEYSVTFADIDASPIAQKIIELYRSTSL